MRLLLAAALAVGFTTSAFAADKGVTVELGGMKSTPPADWKEEQPSSTMRLTQFKLPKAEGDKDDAELALFAFPGGSGSLEQNLKRQEAKFEINGKPEVTEIKIGDIKGAYQDIKGTFLKKFPPFAPDAKITKMGDYRQIYVVFEAGGKQYYMTLLGPAKTIEKHKAGFDAWVKNFK